MTAVHINRSTNAYYVGYVRPRGAKKWVLAVEARLRDEAALDLTRKFLADSSIKRARLVMTADWYEAGTVIEMVRP